MTEPVLFRMPNDLEAGMAAFAVVEAYRDHWKRTRKDPELTDALKIYATNVASSLMPFAGSSHWRTTPHQTPDEFEVDRFLLDFTFDPVSAYRLVSKVERHITAAFGLQLGAPIRSIFPPIPGWWKQPGILMAAPPEVVILNPPAYRCAALAELAAYIDSRAYL